MSRMSRVPGVSAVKSRPVRSLKTLSGLQGIVGHLIACIHRSFQRQYEDLGAPSWRHIQATCPAAHSSCWTRPELVSTVVLWRKTPTLIFRNSFPLSISRRRTSIALFFAAFTGRSDVPATLPETSWSSVTQRLRAVRERPSSAATRATGRPKESISATASALNPARWPPESPCRRLSPYPRQVPRPSH